MLRLVMRRARAVPVLRAVYAAAALPPPRSSPPPPPRPRPWPVFAAGSAFAVSSVARADDSDVESSIEDDEESEPESDSLFSLSDEEEAELAVSQLANSIQQPTADRYAATHADWAAFCAAKSVPDFVKPTRVAEFVRAHVAAFKEKNGWHMGMSTFRVMASGLNNLAKKQRAEVRLRLSRTKTRQERETARSDLRQIRVPTETLSALAREHAIRRGRDMNANGDEILRTAPSTQTMQLGESLIGRALLDKGATRMLFLYNLHRVCCSARVVSPSSAGIFPLVSKSLHVLWTPRSKRSCAPTCRV